MNASLLPSLAYVSWCYPRILNLRFQPTNQPSEAPQAW